MKTMSLISAVSFSLTCALIVNAQAGTDRILRDAITSSDGVALTGSDRLTTVGTFQPPVEIKVVAKTDSTNLRLTYAADQVIFNWEMNPEELRVDGGPASGHHRVGAGKIPTNKFVTIRWVVTNKGQSIYVDNELRFQHEGDYSGISRPVSIFPGFGSKITVKSVTVKPLSASSQ
ncbi:MAG: hypothetical protein EPO07_07805 [Verrucomicrobia bacterium]|nr:MAG: hypothetical protein EPO07_07805 [Verrucomicrobiota bacterium]